LGFEFAWQPRFHDHIIRNDPEYQRINDYIESNPENWDKDRFYK
jgi:putative transposase